MTEQELLEYYKKQTLEYPYHNKQPESKAELAALMILNDFCDRRGIKNKFVDIKQSVREEIVKSVVDIINFNMSESSNDSLSARIRELEDSVTCLEQGADNIVEDIRYSISFLEKYLK